MLELDGDRRLDLSHLGLGEFRVLVSLGVVFDDYLEGFFMSVLANKISGALRDEAEKGY